MKLIIMYKGEVIRDMQVNIVRQDNSFGMNRLYYEKPCDEKGKGTCIVIEDRYRWIITE